MLAAAPTPAHHQLQQLLWHSMLVHQTPHTMHLANAVAGMPPTQHGHTLCSTAGGPMPPEVVGASGHALGQPAAFVSWPLAAASIPTQVLATVSMPTVMQPPGGQETGNRAKRPRL